MYDVCVCVGCLATDVRMYNMSSCSLLQPYQHLTGKELSEEMPKKLCFECAALVNKFNLFRDKCERAHLLLLDMYEKYDEISEEFAIEIDRQQNGLTSSCQVYEQHNVELCQSSSARRTTRKSQHVTSKPIKKSEIETETVKFESVNDKDVVKTEVEVVKPEVNNIKLESVEVPFIDFGDSIDFDNYLEENTQEQKTKVRSTKKRKYTRITTTSQDFKATEIILTPEEAKRVYTQRQKSKQFRKAKFRCTLCYRFYRDERSYDRHKIKHDPKKGDYECDTCRIRFPSRSAMRIHVNVKHSRKYSCNLCPKVSYTREIARLHYKVHEKGGFTRPRKRKAEIKRKTMKVATPDEFDTIQETLTQERMLEIVRERQFSDGYRAARYKCTLCYKGFNEDKPFENHLKQHNPIAGLYQCDLCKIHYKSRRKLYKHISCNHMKKYTCKTCSHTCYNRASAQKHYAWHKGVVYTCHICGAAAARMSTHLSHLRIKHPSSHICGECGESFVSKKGLYHHHNKMHSVKYNTETIEGTGPYCAECDIQFSSQQVWTKHILISPKHELERHTIVNGCQYCGETFPTAQELKRHNLNIHKRHRKTLRRSQRMFPVQCTQCEETMVSSGKYWQHFRTQHPGKQFPLTRSSFICEYCGNWFKHKSALEIHAQTHSDKRSHQCSKCPKKFVKPSSLAAHAESHEGQFTCDVCNRQFAYKHALTNHFRTHTTEKPHVCEWCGKTFAYDCNLKKHELTVHCPPPLPSSSHHI